MPLKFPNARLFVHQLLAGDRLSGAQAIAEGACQFGLISPDCVPDVLQPTGDHQCQCLATAKNVVKKHFEQQAEQAARPPVDAEEVWSAIERHIDRHPQVAMLQSAANGNSQLLANACHNHAPALFDLMLQQIMRYP
jgi:hypothetical protein